MTRVKIKFPAIEPLFQTIIPVRITDLNYGNHLGNDQLLSIIQEARVQWLTSIGLSELDVGGCGLIMADVMVAYKKEGYYGDQLCFSLFIEEIQTTSFDILYHITAKRAEDPILIAEAKTGMVCFDYKTRKIAGLPQGLLKKLSKKTL